MHRSWPSAAFALLFAGAAHAQVPLAPWFDADGFYNRPDVTLADANRDLTVCRAEAARLKIARNTNTQVDPAMAFSSSGVYDPLVSGAATGIASIMFAIQDASYNSGIEKIEFRDCVVALGYRHYRLGVRRQRQLNREADHGFASLVAAQTPIDGRFNDNEPERNYYAAAAADAYQNAAPRPVAPPAEAPAEAPLEVPEATLAAVETNASSAAESSAPDEAAADAPAQAAIAEPATAPEPANPPPITGDVSRIAPGAVATPAPGMALVVASARQTSGMTSIPVPGQTFKFRQVTADGQFIDLLQPGASFNLRSYFNQDRRRDPTLSGDLDEPRYSTYVIPAGRYVLSDMGSLNACLGTLTFDVADGEVVYLGDFVLQAPGVPMGTLFNPIGNINSGLDNNLRSDLRLSIGDNIEAAREALQAVPNVKARLTRVSYANGYRIPCDGRYIGRVANPAWPSIDPAQATAFHTAMAAAIPREAVTRD